jgi:hypothetical protein
VGLRGILPGQPASAGLQLMMLFGSKGPPTHPAVPRHAPAHLTSAGPVGGHDGLAGLSVHEFLVGGGSVAWASHTGARRHCGNWHLASAGFVGGHDGSAGLSVHRSAGTGRLSDAVWKASEAPGKLVAPSAKPSTTAPAPAALVTMPIEYADPIR